MKITRHQGELLATESALAASNKVLVLDTKAAIAKATQKDDSIVVGVYTPGLTASAANNSLINLTVAFCNSWFATCCPRRCTPGFKTSWTI